jgi:hypothetical protein
MPDNIVTIEFSLGTTPLTTPQTQGETIYPIIVGITSHYKYDPNNNKKQLLTMEDDSDKSFNTLIQKLTENVLIFRKVFPHFSKDLLKSSQRKLEDLKTLSETQSKYKKGEKINIGKKGDDAGPSGVVYADVINKLKDEDMKTKLTALVDKYKDQTQDPTDQVKRLVAKYEGLSGVGAGVTGKLLGTATAEFHIAYNLKALEDAAYIGKHTIDSEPLRHVYLTKDCIITDGYAILPISTGSIKDGVVQDLSMWTGGYGLAWKISNKNKMPFTGGIRTITTFKLDGQDKTLDDIYGENEFTEYDVAVSKIIKNHVYGGSHKTVSKKPPVHKTTRRIYPKSLYDNTI